MGLEGLHDSLPLPSSRSLPPREQFVPFPHPHLSAPATQATLTTPLEAITEIKVQVTLPRGWHFCIGSDSNNSEYRYQVMPRDR